ncbi:MAG: L,D-transpeptidase [Coriobacteriia bacterium]|nr:L,D-transpeptidase [Coriobacteriia bacterium]
MKQGLAVAFAAAVLSVGCCSVAFADEAVDADQVAAAAEAVAVQESDDAVADQPVVDAVADDAEFVDAVADETETPVVSTGDTRPVDDAAVVDPAANKTTDATTVAADDPAAAGAADAATDAGLQAEEAMLQADGWVQSGSNWTYVQSGTTVQDDWVVTDVLPGASSKTDLQRYYLDASGFLVIDRLFQAAQSGVTSWFRSLAAGYVIRGTYTTPDGTMVYFADNDGVLAETGWVVTSKFDQGLQRYWIDQTEHAAVVGYSPDGYDHYTTPEGYVSRGVYKTSDGTQVYLSDNDGKLAETGWVVTSKFGQGLQRYWIDPTLHAAVVGYSTDGYPHYTTTEGYVARGGMTVNGNKVYADNDGKLVVSNWVVTGDFTGGDLQRYWAQADGTFATERLVTAEEAGWLAYATANSYVARGAYKTPDGKLVYMADNEGVLAESGWVVTSKFGQGLQRYWIDPALHAAVVGYSTDGYPHYTTSEGYVARGGVTLGTTKVFADNDGRVVVSTWVVTGDFTGGVLQRYWAQADATFATSRLITAAEAGWAAYATSNSYVARFAYTETNGYVYLANNDGLLSPTGWVVSDIYGQGLQRYWVDAATNACIPGFSEEGWDHYTTTAGYVLRGKANTGDNLVLIADGDGLLATAFAAAGWLVTDAYDGEYQRYYLVEVGKSATSGKSYYGARTGLFNVDGTRYYGIPDAGYVLRNNYTLIGPSNDLFYANNDGAERDNSEGWLGVSGVAAWRNVRTTSSATQYILIIDSTACRVFVFQGQAGAWMPLYNWQAGVGNPIYNDNQGTPKGEFAIGQPGTAYDWGRGTPDHPGTGPWRIEYDPVDDIRWVSDFVLDCGFHSTVGWEGGYSDPSQVGKQLSHGCIRLMEGYAHWIYDNCAQGTKVVSY